jgi:ABC-type transport system substrate-binding protein
VNQKTALPVTIALLAALCAGGAGAVVLNAPHSLAAYGENTIFTAFSGRSPKTLDPQKSYSSDETAYTYGIYEPPYQYSYLKRPYALEPRAAEAVADPVYYDRDGKRLPPDADPALIAESVYDIRIKKGILFAPHPAFARDKDGNFLYHSLPPAEAAKKRSVGDFKETGTRELTAEDFVYGIKRLASPRVVSPVLGTLSAYIEGLGDLAKELRDREAALRKAGRGGEWLDLRPYKLKGAEALGRYELRIRIRGKYPQFSYWLTMAFFAPVPWEAERFFAQAGFAQNNFTLNTWPVGTGPFMMKEFLENRRHVMVKNPNFRRVLYPCEGEESDRAKGWLDACGKPLPMVDKVVFEIEKESVPLQTKFLQGYYDSPSIDRIDTGLGYLTAMADSPEKAALYKEKGIQFPQTVDASFFYLGFNWLDPVLGGTGTPEQQERAKKLRQAISIAVNWEENIAIFQKDQGIPASGPLPPGIFGWQDDGPAAFNPVVYRRDAQGRPVRRPIEEAKRLLAEAGWPDGRDAATGRPLVLSFDYQSASQGSKSYLEWFQKQFAKLGIQLDIRATDYNRFQDKMSRGAAQIFLWGWVADYPDAENFLFLFYGPNGKVRHGGENAMNYENPAFDRAFERMKNLSDGPEKQRLINEMITMLQQDAPVLFGYFPKAAAAFQSWVKNAKPTSMIRNTLMYIGVDAKARTAAIEKWNKPVLWPLALIAALLAAAVWGGRAVLRARGEIRLAPKGKGKEEKP